MSKQSPQSIKIPKVFFSHFTSDESIGHHDKAFFFVSNIPKFEFQHFYWTRGPRMCTQLHRYRCIDIEEPKFQP
jgi:hypothetical protein